MRGFGWLSARWTPFFALVGGSASFAVLVGVLAPKVTEAEPATAPRAARPASAGASRASSKAPRATEARAAGKGDTTTSPAEPSAVGAATASSAAISGRAKRVERDEPSAEPEAAEPERTEEPSSNDAPHIIGATRLNVRPEALRAPLAFDAGAAGPGESQAKPPEPSPQAPEGSDDTAPAQAGPPPEPPR